MYRRDEEPRGASLAAVALARGVREAVLSGATATVASMKETASLEELGTVAAEALTGTRWAITDAPDHVPAQPGLYAIYGDEGAWADLRLVRDREKPLYVGKAEKSFVARDLRDHFAASPNAKPQTGSSTVRRSFAALLRETLSLTAVPRNLDLPSHFTNYGLAAGGDDRLNEWMRSRLSLAVWPAPADLRMKLADIETEVIRRFMPPINIAKNPGKLRRLRDARAGMAAEAARWSAG